MSVKAVTIEGAISFKNRGEITSGPLALSSLLSPFSLMTMGGAVLGSYGPI